MRWLRTMILFDRGGIAALPDWQSVHDSFVRSIQSVDFPQGTGSLTLRRKSLRDDGQWDRNGVVYLKHRFFEHMVNVERWQQEAGFVLETDGQATEVTLFPSMQRIQEPVTGRYGAFDFVTRGANGLHVAIEW